MKKINLDVKKLLGTEILSRGELKKILGGDGSGSSSEFVVCGSLSSTTCKGKCRDSYNITIQGTCRYDGASNTCYCRPD